MIRTVNVREKWLLKHTRSHIRTTFNKDNKICEGFCEKGQNKGDKGRGCTNIDKDKYSRWIHERRD